MTGELIGMIFDYLSYFFWSFAYLLVIIYGIRDWSCYQVRMPVAVGAVCFAWELTSVFFGNDVVFGHLVWFLLDAVILIINICILWHQKRHPGLYILYVLAMILAMWFVFSIPAFQGMLYSSFLLDAVISVEYLRKVKTIDSKGKLAIGMMRLLGDFPAWIGYFRLSVMVAVLGLIVFVCNLLYICCCLEENKVARNKRHLIRH